MTPCQCVLYARLHSNDDDVSSLNVTASAPKTSTQTRTRANRQLDTHTAASPSFGGELLKHDAKPACPLLQVQTGGQPLCGYLAHK